MRIPPLHSILPTSFGGDVDSKNPQTSSESFTTSPDEATTSFSKDFSSDEQIHMRRTVLRRPTSRNFLFYRHILRTVTLLCLLGTVSPLKCYCTDDHCVPYGACEGPVCLVGILRENNHVIRTCGTRPIGCHRDDDEKWTDLCACDQPFCNTFSYLRAHTRRDTGPTEEQPLVFHRMDRPDDFQMPAHDAPLSSRSSLLTLLLVVVPLTVGGATIVVVAMNYYCHLC